MADINIDLQASSPEKRQDAISEARELITAFAEGSDLSDKQAVQSQALGRVATRAVADPELLGLVLNELAETSAVLAHAVVAASTGSPENASDPAYIEGALAIAYVVIDDNRPQPG